MSRNVSVQHLRGIAANIPALNVGEFYFATDTNQVFVGSSSGNQLVGPPVTNSSSASQTINPSSSAILTGSLLKIPVTKLKVGSSFHWTIAVSKTASGTLANSFNVFCGTTGTNSDTLLFSFSLPAGTAVADAGDVRIDVVCRGPLSSSGIFTGMLSMVHNLASTGLGTTPTVVLLATASAFDVTQANLILSVSCSAAVSTTLTFGQVTGLAYNL